MKICDLLKNVDIELVYGDETTELDTFERDSRKVKNGDCYVAIVGDNFDGNNFIVSAIENGAKSIICSRNLYDNEMNIVIKNNINVLKVENTVEAIQNIAKYKRSLIDVPIVAITGSVGKTSTKDTIAGVLSSKYRVLKTEGNLNNEIGVPFTILKYKDEDIIVVEMGMNGFRQISVLTDIAKPTLAVVTNIGTAHIGILGSRENILKAKMEILEGLQGNTVIINNDNDLLHKWALDNINRYNVVTYGINENSSYNAKEIDSHEDYSEFNVDGDLFRINIPGEHFVLNALCAYAVGRHFNLSNTEIKNGLLNLKLTEKRMQKVNSYCGAIIINDAYNANYDSMKAALEYLRNVKNRRKIAILGDMLELGKFSKQIHSDVGREVYDIDVLITVGNEAKNIANNAKISKENIFSFDNNDDAIKKIKMIIGENDLILVKASNGMKFTNIVDIIKSF